LCGNPFLSASDISRGISRSAEGHPKDQRQIMTVRYRLRAEIAHSFFYLPLVFA